jgi:NAD(P)-dependent dehydrogenase (short-subunit alcohol dehydrogenase family)
LELVPMQDVVGKVAFITGGASGIGLGIARAFADAGMKVVITYRTPKHLEEALQDLKPVADRVHAIRVDVTDRHGMEQAAEETVRVFGKVHVLVNNAGIVTFGPLSEASYEDWDWTMGVNLTGVFNGVHAFLPRLQAHGEGGQIITASSSAGLFAIPNLGAYVASKFAVLGLMETLRMELAETNIGVLVYCPGFVITRIAEARRNRSGSLATSNLPPDIATQAEKPEASARDEESSMDPLELGRLVLRGMQSNDLYILTHAEFEPIMRERAEALLASIPRDVPQPDLRIAASRWITQNLT